MCEREREKIKWEWNSEKCDSVTSPAVNQHSAKMVVGEKDTTKAGDQQVPMPQIAPSPSAINNIMRGISNTGTVKMNNDRKKLRQR